MNDHKTVTLDVREEIRNGREPFSKIMSTVAALNADEQLRLIAPFEPTPLFRVLARQGFSHRSQEIDGGDWEVLFTRLDGENSSEPSEAASVAVPQPPPTVTHAKVVDADARGLEPPQPLVAILETLAALPPDTELRAHTDRRPMHLYPQLEARGFTGESVEQSDGSFITHVRRR